MVIEGSNHEAKLRGKMSPINRHFSHYSKVASSLLKLFTNDECLPLLLSTVLTTSFASEKDS